jgi:2-polyprenyl-3-methyl-5-hydroxy-6-metoxy-1,4-benzoquinol methylase
VPEDRTAALTARQAREVEYHRHHAAQHADLVERRIPTGVIRDAARRPWNAYWTLYDRLQAWKVEGRRVLVPGCGFGHDAILLSLMGAEVSANDISPESVEIALRRAAKHGVAFDTRVMPVERLDYPDEHFDAVVLIDILHHVDIPAAMPEIRRVLRPDAMVFGNELPAYHRHSAGY